MAANAFTLNLVPRLSRVKAGKPLQPGQMRPYASWNAAFTPGEKKAQSHARSPIEKGGEFLRPQDRANSRQDPQISAACRLMMLLSGRWL